MGDSAPRGKRLMPAILDDRAASTPDRTYASIARADWRRDGYQDVSYRQIANAVQKMSWWLDEKLDTVDSIDSLAYMGPNDLRYLFLIMAATKTNRRLLIPDPVMSTGARLHLVESTGCTALLVAESASEGLEAVHRERPRLPLILVPSLEECLGPREIERYAYNKTFEEAREDPVCVFHTSGTTGNPKPYTYTHAIFNVMDFHRTLTHENAPEANFYVGLDKDTRMLSTWPAPWTGGIFLQTIAPLFNDVIVVLPPADAPLPMTAEFVDEIHQIVTIDGGAYVPSVLKGLCKTPATFENLKSLKYIKYAGAPLEPWVGDLLSQHLQVIAGYGSTEMAPLPIYTAQDKDWMYNTFHPACGWRMEPYGHDLHELVIERKEELAPFQPIFMLFPDQDTYHSNDLFRRHSENDNLWHLVGRADDFVKLSWLAKFHGKDIERVVETHSHVRAATTGGDGRDRPCLICELDPSLSEESKVKTFDEIWQIIQEVNQVNAEEIQLKKDLVLLADPRKPFIRTLKGAVDRRRTLSAYKDDIETAYAKTVSRSLT